MAISDTPATLVPTALPILFSKVCEVVYQSSLGTNGRTQEAMLTYAPGVGTFNATYESINGYRNSLQNFRGFEFTTAPTDCAFGASFTEYTATPTSIGYAAHLHLCFALPYAVWYPIETSNPEGYGISDAYSHLWLYFNGSSYVNRPFGSIATQLTYFSANLQLDPILLVYINQVDGYAGDATGYLSGTGTYVTDIAALRNMIATLKASIPGRLKIKFITNTNFSSNNINDYTGEIHSNTWLNSVLAGTGVFAGTNGLSDYTAIVSHQNDTATHNQYWYKSDIITNLVAYGVPVY